MSGAWTVPPAEPSPGSGAPGDAGAAPPPRPVLRFRAGTYASFLRAMLARLPLEPVVVDGRVLRPLAGLDPVGSRDFAGALVDAWAMVGDVLTFYQERILNEGFLRTAVEPRSVRLLAAQLGMPLQPGLASRTVLAFGVAGVPGAPDAVQVPAGTAAQTIPGAGETPQTFETLAPLQARPAWNALAPAPAFTTVAPTLAVEDTGARLQGTGTGLAVGAPVLAAAGDGGAWAFGTVTAVEPGTATRETRVAWATAPDGTRGAGTMEAPSVWAFGRTARLFGYNAPAWDSLTTAQKRAHRDVLGGVFVLSAAGTEWTGVSRGLPDSDVQALAVDGGGRLYAGTAGRGIHVSADGGATWAAAGPRYGEVFSFALAANGAVYAGMGRGRVYRSSDGGASWDSVSGGTTLAPGLLGDAHLVATGLPPSPVRALFDDGAGTLYAGTDFGVYESPEAAPAWTALPFLAGLYSPPAGPPPAVWCIAATPWGGIAAGTDQGVWSVPGGEPLGTGFPATVRATGLPNVVRALYARNAGSAGASALLAATDAGIFSLASTDEAWTFAGPRSQAVKLPASALAATPRGLMAATTAGVFLQGASGGWTAVPATSAPAPSWGPGDCGAPTPVPAPPGLNNPAVSALAAGAGIVAAASSFAGFQPEAWPGPPICGDTLYLSGVLPQVVPGSWMVLQQAPGPAGGGPEAAVEVVRVVSARTLTLERYGRRGQATEVRVERVGAPVKHATAPAKHAEAPAEHDTAPAKHAEPPVKHVTAPAKHAEPPVKPVEGPVKHVGGLGRFGLTTTTVFAASRPLALVRSRLPDLLPVAGSRIRLAGAVTPLPAGRSVSVTGRRIRAAVWPRAGVFVPGKTGWKAAGLASVDVVAVAWGPGRVVLAAVGGAPGAAGPAAGVYASADAATDEDGVPAWIPAAGRLAGVPVHALASGSGAVWAAGPGGKVFTSADGVAWARAGRPGRVVTALCVAPDGEVYAATLDAGVLRRGSKGWVPVGRGRPPGVVRAVAALPGGALAAATGEGVWWLASGSARWTPGGQGLRSRDVRALAALPDGELLAGTGGAGVFSVRVSAGVPDGAWAPACTGLPRGAWTVTALVADAEGRAWAGTRGAGCWTRGPGAAAAWKAAPLGAANDVRALAAGPDGVAAGCGAVPLLAGGGEARASLALQPLLSLPDPVHHDLDRGILTPSVRKAFQDAGVSLSATAVVRVQAAGEAWWIGAADGVLLLRRDAGAVRVRRPGALATLMGPAPTSRAGVAVADPAGHAGTLTPRTGELLWQPSSPAAQPVGEVAVVASTAAAGLAATALTLRRPLRNAYDPATVQLCGNLVAATLGATQAAWPRPEVLGSGDAALAGQSFSLARAPLTWLAPGPAGSTLRVWVNGVEWTQVETLFACGPGDAAYAVTVDEAGAATVHFGDGVNGARLPTGAGNVTAQYRVGIGGDVGPGRATVTRAAPLGVRSVTNPVPAEGGAPGQTVAQAVATAPVRARVLQRVVALRDFADFAATAPGIARAAAEPLRDPGGRAVVAVTVAGQPGAEVPDAGRLAALARDMAAAGAQGAFRVLACEAVGFVVQARVACLPGWRPQAVAPAAALALEQAYAPASRALGQGVASSSVVAVLQGVPGVAGVDLTAFHLEGDTPGVATWLEARGARMGPHGVLPAQVLVPAASGGIWVEAS